MLDSFLAKFGIKKLEKGVESVEKSLIQADQETALEVIIDDAQKDVDELTRDLEEQRLKCEKEDADVVEVEGILADIQAELESYLAYVSDESNPKSDRDEVQIDIDRLFEQAKPLYAKLEKEKDEAEKAREIFDIIQDTIDAKQQELDELKENMETLGEATARQEYLTKHAETLASLQGKGKESSNKSKVLGAIQDKVDSLKVDENIAKNKISGLKRKDEKPKRSAAAQKILDAQKGKSSPKNNEEMMAFMKSQLNK